MDAQDNPYDGSAAVVVPQNVEKVPLYHWRPGSRVLSVGSRDGASFAGDLPADEARSYRRPLSPEMIGVAAAQVGIDTWCASWTAALRYAQGLATLFASGLQHSVVVSAGRGDPQVLEYCLQQGVSAWVLLLSDDGDAHPLARRIMEAAPHLEVVIGLTHEQRPWAFADLPWERAAALHLLPARATIAVGAELHRREDSVRAALSPSLAIYDSRQQTTVCAHCGAELIWRHGGRSRLAEVDGERGQCARCAAPLPWLTGS